MSDFPWEKVKNYDEIIYEKYDGIAKITINRPERRNAFTPKTNVELFDAFSLARDDQEVGVIILTGANHDGKDEDQAFCSGGDQKVRGNGGYVGEDNIPRLNVLDLQRLIRVVPKPVIAMVNGYAVGGGHVLHILCDLSIAAETASSAAHAQKIGELETRSAELTAEQDRLHAAQLELGERENALSAAIAQALSDIRDLEAEEKDVDIRISVLDNAKTTDFEQLGASGDGRLPQNFR